MYDECFVNMVNDETCTDYYNSKDDESDYKLFFVNSNDP